MKFPFVARSIFDAMLREKNSQISDRDRQIADLKAEHDLLGGTQDRLHEIIRELHGQLGSCKVEVCSLEHQLCFILESLPESVFNKICRSLDKRNVAPRQNNHVAQRTKPTT